MGIALLA